jgi:arsenite-transporting ATPase
VTPASRPVLLFTGKGGVGKTTIAAATALRCADAGRRTIVLSTDPAHSLADSFDTELGEAATPIADRLWGEQLDPQQRLEDSWGDIKDWLTDVMRWAGVDAVEAEELAMFPGLDELFALTDINKRAAAEEWDVVVVDCAPTAETLRLLSLPDVLAWWMHRVFPTSRTVTRLVRPLVRTVSSMPVADDDVFTAGERFYDGLAGVKELLADLDRTRIRLVVNPEKMVIAEARRTATYLSLFGYGVDAVVANRLLPDAVSDPWFDEWKAVQATHLRAIEEGFAPLPVLTAQLAPTEVVGLEALRRFGEALYGEDDPTRARHSARPLTVERVDEGYELALDLPFASREDVDLGRRDDELLVRVGSYRRNLMLPDSLRRRAVAGATLRDDRLVVRFIDR